MPLSSTTLTRMCVLPQGQTGGWVLGCIINVLCVVETSDQISCVQGAVMQSIIDSQRVSLFLQRMRTSSLQQLWRAVFRSSQNSDSFRVGQRISAPNIRLESNASAEESPLLPRPARPTSRRRNTSSF